MNFNFKQALEEIRFLQTPEGKAEEFLRLTLNTIKQSIDINRIEKLCFALYRDKSPVYYKLYAYYYYRVGNISRGEQLCFSNPFFDQDEVLLVYDIIINKLKEEGFKPEEAIPSFIESEYHHLIKGFMFNL